MVGDRVIVIGSLEDAMTATTPVKEVAAVGAMASSQVSYVFDGAKAAAKDRARDSEPALTSWSI